MTNQTNKEIDKYISENAGLGFFQIFVDPDFYRQYIAKIASTIIILVSSLVVGFVVDVNIKILMIVLGIFFVYEMYKYNRNYASKVKLKIVQEAIELKKNPGQTHQKKILNRH